MGLPHFTEWWELEFCLFFKKWGRVHFSPKKWEVGKIVEEWRLLIWERVTYVYLLIFVLIDPRNITVPDIYTKVTSIIIYPNFWDKVLSKIYILYNIFQTLLVYSWNRHLYQNLACRTHFQLNNHDLFENVDWKSIS